MARRVQKDLYWGSFVLDWFYFLQDSDLRISDYKVLFFLCNEMKHDDNTAYVKQKEIARTLNMDKGNISKSIKRLCEKQFITKHKNGYMINPHLFYIGRHAHSRLNVRRNFDDLLSENDIVPRFFLNEDEHKLELVEELNYRNFQGI